MASKRELKAKAKGKAPEGPGAPGSMHVTTIRLRSEYITDADQLAKDLSVAPDEYAKGELSRAQVLQMAVARGLAVLKAERDAAKKKTSFD